MQIISNILLTFVFIANLLIGMIAYLGNKTSKIHRYFAMFAISVSLWVASNLLFIIVEPSLRLPVALASYASAILLATSLLFFCIHFTKVRIKLKAKVLIFLTSLVAMIFSAWPGVVGIRVTQDLQIITNALALGMFAAVMGFLFLTSAWLLLSSYKKATGIFKDQLRIVIIGILLAMIGGVIFNLALPLLGNYDFVDLGPVTSIIMVWAIAYAIIKFSLFDIKVAVARLLSYTFALLLIAAFYVVVVFNLISVIFPDNQVSSSEGILYTIFAVVIAITFQPIKSFFDRVTDKIFFKGSYNLRDTLDKFGGTIIKYSSLNLLLNESSKILHSALKTSYVGILVVDSSREISFRQFGTKNIKLTQKDILQILQIKDQLAFYNTSDLPAKIRQTMKQANISAIGRLETSHGVQGLLIVGEKRSGDPIYPKDANLLSVSIDELAVAVENVKRFEEIKNFNVTLKQEVETATSQLRRSNKRLRELDTIKDEFMSIASHQLRTPLTSVKGYISMVLDGDAGPLKKEQTRLLREAYASSQRMVYLIGDFLNVSRIRTGKFVLQTERVNLSKIIKEETDQLLPAAKNRDLELDVQLPDQVPDLMLDKDKIRQVIMNFIDNAIFYTPAKGRISVSLLINHKEVRFLVKDTGVGVPEHEQHKLFTKFFRASNAAMMRPDGTGVGLFLAKKVIILHGGILIFKSTPKKGSTFGFSIPLDRVKVKDKN